MKELNLAVDYCHLLQEELEVADHGTKVEVYNGVSTEDEPSAAWGWHQFPRKLTIIVGYVGVLSLIGLLFGNHKGKVEDIFLVGIAALLLIAVLVYTRKSSPSWKPHANTQTVTSHNKPEGHHEPDWAADQRDLTGSYAKLTTAELRSWNQPGVGSDGVENVPTPSYGLVGHK